MRPRPASDARRQVQPLPTEHDRCVQQEHSEGAGEPALPPKMAIDLNQLQGLPERQGSILSRHVTRLQQQRKDFNTPVLTFRQDDLEQLAAAYKTTPEMLRRSLQEWGVFRSGQAPQGERPEIEPQPPEPEAEADR